MWSWGCKSELSFSHPKSNELCATMMSCYLKAQDHNTFLPSFHKHSHPQHTNTCIHPQHMHTPRRAHPHPHPHTYTNVTNYIHLVDGEHDHWSRMITQLPHKVHLFGQVPNNACSVLYKKDAPIIQQSTCKN